MTLKQYFPLSVAILLVVIAGARFVDFPAIPFVLILLAGETLVGFQLEDGKVAHFMSELMHSTKSKS